jgi:hypothetical protein
VIDLQGEIKCENGVKFSIDFVLESLEALAWQRISWELGWSVIKHSWEWDKEIPEFTGNILLRSDILASL